MAEKKLDPKTVKAYDAMEALRGAIKGPNDEDHYTTESVCRRLDRMIANQNYLIKRCDERAQMGVAEAMAIDVLRQLMDQLKCSGNLQFAEHDYFMKMAELAAEMANKLLTKLGEGKVV